MKDPAGPSTLKLRLRHLEFGLRLRLVARADRGFDPFQKCAYPADPAGIDLCAPRIAAVAFLRRFMMGHYLISIAVVSDRRPAAEGREHTLAHPPASSASRLPNQRFLKSGDRFSENAAIPSLRSSSAKVA